MGARAMQMLEALKEKGVVLPVPTEDKPKKRVVYTNKKKKFTQKSEEKTSISEEIVNTDPVSITIEEDVKEKTPEIETKKKTPEAIEVKDAWDAESDEEVHMETNQEEIVNMEVE